MDYRLYIYITQTDKHGGSSSLVVQSAGCITGVDHQAEPGKVTVAGLQWLGDETKR